MLGSVARKSLSHVASMTPVDSSSNESGAIELLLSLSINIESV